MDDILLYDPYTNTKILTTKARMDYLSKQLKDYCIKVELKKPFLSKLYEMFGRGL